MEVSVQPGRLSGHIPVPPSKSHTIRALLVAAAAGGTSRIRSPLFSRDTRACMRAVSLLGAVVREEGADLLVEGTGGRFSVPEDVIDVENSGTTLYLAGAMAALIEGGRAVFTGDAQLRRRTAGPLLASLHDLGARAESTRGNGCAPLVIGGPLRGGSTSIACPTSQYLSALLLACPLGKGDSLVEVVELNEHPYIDMTLWWLKAQGVALEREGYDRFRIPGGQCYRAFDLTIPGDYSSATFFLCAAAVTGSTLTLTNLYPDDPQGDREVLDILERMGCTVEVSPERREVTITGGPLSATKVDMTRIPDALPALAVTACYAEGTTRLYNAAHTRLKETDRIAVMAQELSRLGARVEELPDGLLIHGPCPLTGGIVSSHDDHRVAMALAVGALAARAPVTIEGAEATEVTFPEFFSLLEAHRTG
ncbi:3-phosphoshikimate 1-carboxyvinyltransferase [Spirochaeta thermophila DSM 6578]|uniref:3-phosphoshikimate 1-carboxyvinyltransferase n=1 Tax=Winmispira thermophila (strain ATCC 700085 / DSM 6578 / Z-1203) TaxID=869211 RepID=G0GDY9_WINT7|nr:3-phosphoshikimate 1-carboxyvinyltransferase [Spirochaeta thermophila]AEJ60621.1 3-phosphoshikimate 1-carboxyvinyltransferase [Spirochaeta thermophila DSM 6578]